ncbi:MAG: C25 family cysteine peptidase [Planctomycetota bacterium]
MAKDQLVGETVKTKISIFSSTKTLLATFLVLALTGGLFAYAAIGHGGLLLKNKVSRVSTRSETITFSITAPELNKEIIDKDGIKYARLSYVDEDKNVPETEGIPEVPYLVKTIAIPDNAQNITVKATATAEEVTTEEITVYPIPNKIEVKDEKGNIIGFDEEFYKDEAAYTIDEFQPTSATEKREDFYFRSQHLLSIKVLPLAFNPKTKQLQIIPSMDVTVSYTVNLTATSKKNTLNSSANMLKNTVVNPEAVTAAASGQVKATSGTVSFLTQAQLRSVSNNVDYLIITHTDFFSSTELNTFANYRANYDSFKIAVVNVADIYNEFTGADDVEKIKAFTQYAYDNWQKAPEYLLLLGDLEWVPTHAIFQIDDLYIQDDEYYAYISGGDTYADMAVGRFPARSVAEITNIYNKIYHYEQDSIIPGDYRSQSASFMSDSPSAPTGVNTFKSYGFNAYYNYDGSQTDFINNINKNHLEYFGHGGSYGIEIFSVKDFGLLTNSYQNPFIYSGGCLTANMMAACTFYPDNLYKPHCLGEAFVMMPEKGAVAYYGNTTATVDSCWRNTANYILNHFHYQAGEMMMSMELGEDEWCRQIEVLLGDPALHLLGHRTTAGQPELTVTPNKVAFNTVMHKIWVQITNIGPGDAVNPPVEAYIYDDPQNPVLLGTETNTGTVPAGGTLDVYVSVPDDMTLSTHKVLIKVNPSTNLNHIPESFELNNKYVKTITLKPIASVVTVTDNGSPVQSAQVAAYDNNGNMVGESGTTNANGVALVAVNRDQAVRFHVTYNRCLAIITDECGTPCNISAILPAPTHYVFLDQNGDVFNGATIINVYDKNNNTICLDIHGSEAYPYIHPGLEVTFEASSSDVQMVNVCLSDIQFCTTPCNITLNQPTPTHVTYRDTNGNNTNAQIYAYSDTTRQKRYCASPAGINFYLKEGLKSMFAATENEMTYVWTPLIEVPYDITICEAGDCCIDGTALSACSSTKEWCNPTTLKPEKNCHQCGYTCQSDQTCMPSGVCATGTKKVNPEETL